MNNDMLKTLLPALMAVLVSAPLQAADAPNLAEQAAASYRELARFPEWSQPLAPGSADPIAAEREASVQTLTGPGGAGPALSVWASDMRYEAGDTARFFASLHQPVGGDADALPAPASTVGGWTVSAELVDGNGRQLAHLTYRDDGKGGDDTAGDGIYSASYQLPEAQQPPVGQAVNVGIKVTAVNEAEETRSAIGGFLYSHPGARLTGNFRDRVANGNLLIGAEVQVEAAGRYHLSGVLGGVGGLPLATTQTALQLEPGSYWIELPVYGLILREAGLSGPFTLNSVTLTTTGAMPNALGPVLSNAHTTGLYLPTVFSNQPFNRADLLDAAARLEAIVAR